LSGTVREEPTVTSTPQLREVEKPDILDKHFEKSDVAIARHLELRPTIYSDTGPHPDPRPCPSWCWVGQSNGEYHHEIEPTRTGTAVHSMEGVAHVVATHYWGYTYRDGVVHAASIETHLEQVGQLPPRLRVALRYGTGDPDDRMAFDEILKVSVPEARELIAVLTYFAEIAETG
jgi:hypothetical protein